MLFGNGTKTCRSVSRAFIFLGTPNRDAGNLPSASSILPAPVPKFCHTCPPSSSKLPPLTSELGLMDNMLLLPRPSHYTSPQCRPATAKGAVPTAQHPRFRPLLSYRLRVRSDDALPS